MDGKYLFCAPNGSTGYVADAIARGLEKRGERMVSAWEREKNVYVPVSGNGNRPANARKYVEACRSFDVVVEGHECCADSDGNEKTALVKIDRPQDIPRYIAETKVYSAGVLNLDFALNTLLNRDSTIDFKGKQKELIGFSEERMNILKKFFKKRNISIQFDSRLRPTLITYVCARELADLYGINSIEDLVKLYPAPMPFKHLSRGLLPYTKDRPAEVCTELTGFAKHVNRAHGLGHLKTVYSHGSTESKARFSDIILEIVDTGGSVKENFLKRIEEVFLSTPVAFVDETAYAGLSSTEKKFIEYMFTAFSDGLAEMTEENPTLFTLKTSYINAGDPAFAR